MIARTVLTAHTARTVLTARTAHVLTALSLRASRPGTGRGAQE